MRRRIGALLVALTTSLAGPAAAPVRADANQAPIAVDDPAIPGCAPFDHWGGAFPIVEDVWSPGAGQGFEDRFWFFGSCDPTANDIDPDGDPLTLELVGQPDHGEATWLSEGGVSLLGYRPDPDWSTPPGDQPGGSWVSDVIRYRVTDGQAWSSVAAYRVWVAPINDPPTFTPGAALVEGMVGGPAVSVPWATAIDAGPGEPTQQVSFVVETDTRNAPTMFATPPAIDGDGTLTFTPGAEPGLAVVTVTAKDDGGLEDWGAGTSTLHPPDDTGDPVTFEIVVWPAGAPVAVDDTATTDEDTATRIDVLANDTGVGATVTIAGATDGAHGSTQTTGDAVVYTPVPDATGDDAFAYTIADDGGATSTATVHVAITPVNDDPLAVGDELVLGEGAGPTAVDVLANDTDADGDRLAIDSVGPAGHGTAEAAGGVAWYAPEPGFTGADAFAYTVVDGLGGTGVARVTVTVGADGVPPVVVPGSVGVAGTRLGTGAVSLRFRWTAADGASGVSAQAVGQRRRDGTWRLLARPAPGVTSVVLATDPGRSEALRVRATDARGNTSAWAAWPEVRALVRQETASSVTWGGTWRRSFDRADSGGGTRWAGRAGHRATLDTWARAVAWVGRRQPGGGRAEVWVDGVRVAIVDARASVVQHRAILFRVAWPTRGHHRVQVRTVGGGRVDVDAFVIVR